MGPVRGSPLSRQGKARPHERAATDQGRVRPGEAPGRNHGLLLRGGGPGDEEDSPPSRVLQGWRGVLPGAELPTSALPDHLRGGSCRNSTKPRAAYLQRQARDHRWHGRQRRPRRHPGSGCDRRPRWERLRSDGRARQRRDLRRQRRGLPRRRPRARTPCSARRAGTRSAAGRARTAARAARETTATSGPDCEVEKSIEKSGDLPPRFH